VAVVDIYVTDKAAGGSDHDPAAATGVFSIIGALPGELCAGRSVSNAVTNIKIAAERDKGDLAIGTGPEGDVRFPALIKVIIVPDIHLDDPPAAGEGLSEGGNLGHQTVSATSVGKRTRL